MHSGKYSSTCDTNLNSVFLPYSDITFASFRSSSDEVGTTDDQQVEEGAEATLALPRAHPTRESIIMDHPVRSSFRFVIRIDWLHDVGFA